MQLPSSRQSLARGADPMNEHDHLSESCNRFDKNHLHKTKGKDRRRTGEQPARRRSAAKHRRSSALVPDNRPFHRAGRADCCQSAMEASPDSCACFAAAGNPRFSRRSRSCAAQLVELPSGRGPIPGTTRCSARRDSPASARGGNQQSTPRLPVLASINDSDLGEL